MCLEKKENAITDYFHLLYIECPIESGFSVCHKETEVNDLETLGKNAVELFVEIFKKNPLLKEAEFYFERESLSGLSMPTVINHLIKELDIDFKGAIENKQNPILRKSLTMEIKLQNITNNVKLDVFLERPLLNDMNKLNIMSEGGDNSKQNANKSSLGYQAMDTELDSAMNKYD